MFEKGALQAAGLHEPLEGEVPLYDIVPAYLLLQSQAGPAILFGTEMLQATRLQDPLGKLPLQEMAPAYPSLQTRPGPSPMSEKATLQAAGPQDPNEKLSLLDTGLVSPLVQILIGNPSLQDMMPA